MQFILFIKSGHFCCIFLFNRISKVCFSVLDSKSSVTLLGRVVNFPPHIISGQISIAWVSIYWVLLLILHEQDRILQWKLCVYANLIAHWTWLFSSSSWTLKSLEFYGSLIRDLKFFRNILNTNYKTRARNEIIQGFSQIQKSSFWPKTRLFLLRNIMVFICNTLKVEDIRRYSFKVYHFATPARSTGQVETNFNKKLVYLHDGAKVFALTRYREQIINELKWKNLCKRTSNIFRQPSQGKYCISELHNHCRAGW